MGSRATGIPTRPDTDNGRKQVASSKVFPSNEECQRDVKSVLVHSLARPRGPQDCGCRKGKARPRAHVIGGTRIERQPIEQTPRSEGRVDSK